VIYRWVRCKPCDTLLHTILYYTSLNLINTEKSPPTLELILGVYATRHGWPCILYKLIKCTPAFSQPHSPHAATRQVGGRTPPALNLDTHKFSSLAPPPPPYAPSNLTYLPTSTPTYLSTLSRPSSFVVPICSSWCFFFGCGCCFPLMFPMGLILGVRKAKRLTGLKVHHDGFDLVDFLD